MIKLERTFTPVKLNPDFVSSKTIEFKENGTPVWNIDWLKKALSDLSFGKCAYCECSLTEGGAYLEVEHFEDKAHYSDKVLEWDNLLPSCKRCNGAKKTLDVNATPIINPFTIDPRNELFFRLYKLKGKTTIGITTEGALRLNDIERGVKKRFEVGQSLEDLITVCSERLTKYLEETSTIRRNKLLNTLEEILKECQPKTIFSATCATILHSDHTYISLKSKMEEIGLWNEELQSLHDISSNIALEIR